MKNKEIRFFTTKKEIKNRKINKKEAECLTFTPKQANLLINKYEADVITKAEYTKQLNKLWLKGLIYSYFYILVIPIVLSIIYTLVYNFCFK